MVYLAYFQGPIFQQTLAFPHLELESLDSNTNYGATLNCKLNNDYKP